MTGVELLLRFVCMFMGGWCIADAARCFSEKKWGWFGFNAILAVNFVAQMIKWIFPQ